ncbi:MAG: hypothetical protein AVDCRST_MAG30-3823, partial [uncultured Solirubrobacteraceae bacterium]
MTPSAGASPRAARAAASTARSKPHQAGAPSRRASRERSTRAAPRTLSLSVRAPAR